MNKLVITLITTMLLASTGAVLAKDGYGGPGKKAQHHQRGPQTMPVIDQMIKALRRLDLDDSQKDQVKAVMQDMKQQLKPIMKETKAGHQQLKNLIKAEVYDAKAVAALAKAEGKMAADRIEIAGKALSDIYSQLTEEQRARLESMAEDRQERRKEKRQRRAGNDQDTP